MSDRFDSTASTSRRRAAHAAGHGDGLGPMAPFVESQTDRLAVLGGLGSDASMSVAGLSCDLSWTVSLV